MRAASLLLLLLATAGALQQLRLKPPVRLQPAAPARFCALRMSEMEVAVTQALANIVVSSDDEEDAVYEEEEEDGASPLDAILAILGGVGLFGFLVFQGRDLLMSRPPEGYDPTKPQGVSGYDPTRGQARVGQPAGQYGLQASAYASDPTKPIPRQPAAGQQQGGFGRGQQQQQQQQQQQFPSQSQYQQGGFGQQQQQQQQGGFGQQGRAPVDWDYWYRERDSQRVVGFICDRLQEPQSRIPQAVVEFLGTGVALDLLRSTEQVQAEQPGMRMGDVMFRLLKDATHLNYQAQEAALQRIRLEGSNARSEPQGARASGWYN